MNVRLLFAVIPGMVVAVANGLHAQDSVDRSLSPDSSQSDAAKPGEAIQTGYFFYDGKYVPLPYRVEENADGVAINGHIVARTMPRRNRGGRFGGFGSRGFGPGSERGFGNRGRSIDHYLELLKSDAVIMASPNRMTLAIQESIPRESLFRTLLSSQRNGDEVEQVLGSLPPFYKNPRFRAWIREFQSPEELTQRMQAFVDAEDEKRAREESTREEKRAAEIRLEKMTYPLTMLGMVLSVFALGHLLMSRPKVGRDQADQQPKPELIRAALISVGLVAGLSALDLTWTILASQAGQMKELNPVGQQLISDPEALATFKITATIVGCSLLLILRRYSSARLASWWMCLVLTLVTFRWLVFNSMLSA